MGFSFIEGAPCLEVRYSTPRSSRRDTCLSPYLNWALRRCRELPRAARSRVSGFVLWPIAAVRNGLGIRQLLGAKRTCLLGKFPPTCGRQRWTAAALGNFKDCFFNKPPSHEPIAPSARNLNVGVDCRSHQIILGHVMGNA